MSVLNIITKVLDDLTGIKYESLFSLPLQMASTKKKYEKRTHLPSARLKLLCISVKRGVQMNSAENR
jgi:hypothetical protein